MSEPRVQVPRVNDANRAGPVTIGVRSLLVGWTGSQQPVVQQCPHHQETAHAHAHGPSQQTQHWPVWTAEANWNGAAVPAGDPVAACR
jgi:hypothetical protein